MESTYFTSGKLRWFVLFGVAFFLLLASCSENASQDNQVLHHSSPDEFRTQPEGSLFIIGGGKRPLPLMHEMVKLANAENEGQVLIIPWASEEPDSSAWYLSQQFLELGIESERITAWINPNDIADLADHADEIFSARLIFFTGGDQNVLMGYISEKGGPGIFKEAYFKGACIAGTSAGAAVMSHLMITGKDATTGNFFEETGFIEANRVLLAPGLGLVSNAIIDQHFTERNRLNRLIAAVLENPAIAGIGINESTALKISKGEGRVVGDSQIIFVVGHTSSIHRDGTLLGGRDYRLDVYLPGEILQWSFH